jgi:hypothetical protein
MSDDFEKAVLINFNYGGNIDPQLKVVQPAEALQEHQSRSGSISTSTSSRTGTNTRVSAAQMSAGASSSIHLQHQAVF